MMAIFGSRKQAQPQPAKKVWGATESQRKLDRRIASYQARFMKAGIDYPAQIDEDFKRMRYALDEEGVRKLVEDGERAIAIVERAVKGGEELINYLNAEISSKRLDPQNEKAHIAAIDAFHRMKQAERDEAERKRRDEQFAREEPIRRAREIDSIKFRIDQLPPQTAAPLRQQLAKVPIEGKPRDYRKAVHDVEKAIAEIEK